MAILILILLRLLSVPVAHAVGIDEAFGSEMGLGEMWEQIKGLLPHGDEAAGLIGTDIESPGPLVENILTIFQTTIGLTAAALVVYAGFRLSVGGMNEEGVTAWKGIMKNVIIGLICALIAEAVIIFFRDFYVEIFS